MRIVLPYREATEEGTIVKLQQQGRLNSQHPNIGEMLISLPPEGRAKGPWIGSTHQANQEWSTQVGQKGAIGTLFHRTMGMLSQLYFSPTHFFPDSPGVKVLFSGT